MRMNMLLQTIELILMMSDKPTLEIHFYCLQSHLIRLLENHMRLAGCGMCFGKDTVLVVSKDIGSARQQIL